MTWLLTELDEKSTKLDFKFEIVIPFDSKEEALKRGNFLEGWNYVIHTGWKNSLKSNGQVYPEDLFCL